MDFPAEQQNIIEAPSVKVRKTLYLLIGGLFLIWFAVNSFPISILIISPSKLKGVMWFVIMVMSSIFFPLMFIYSQELFKYSRYVGLKTVEGYILWISQLSGIVKKRKIEIKITIQNITDFPYTIKPGLEDQKTVKKCLNEKIFLQSGDEIYLLLFNSVPFIVEFQNLLERFKQAGSGKTETTGSCIDFEKVKNEMEVSPLTPPQGIHIRKSAKDGNRVFSFRGGQFIMRYLCYALILIDVSFIGLLLQMGVGLLITSLIFIILLALAVIGLLLTNFYRHEYEPEGEVYHYRRKLGAISFMTKTRPIEGIGLDLSGLPELSLINRVYYMNLREGFSDPRIGGPDAAAMYWLVCALHYQLKTG